MDSDSDIETFQLESINFICAICLRDSKLNMKSESESDITSSYNDSNESESSDIPDKNLRLDCNHIFHRTCIVSWFVYSQDFYCPLCRNRNKKLNKDDLFKLNKLKNIQEEYQLFQFKYYGCNNCEYECICGESPYLLRDPENQNIRRRNWRLEMCKCCGIYILIIGLLILMSFILNNTSSSNINYQKRIPLNFSDDQVEPFDKGILFRRF